jgi:UDP-N-acetylmuramoyl-tripeptide--D-alanyl-D-alanine ligase
MISLPVAEITKIMGGEYAGPAGLIINGEFRFDSREIQRGDVFLALAGEKEDGHSYVSAAFAKGAVLAITTRDVKEPHIKVKAVLPAIAELATFVRNHLTEMKVIGITGSQGKTTTKDILASLLSAKGECIAPSRSFNNELGVPITLLRARSDTRYCILEMGARHRGDIARLTEIAKPDIGIVLKVGTAHLGEFGSQEAIAETKSELIRGLTTSATAILGSYDQFTPNMSRGMALKTITFGETAQAQVRAADIEMHGIYPAFDLVTPEGRERVELQLIGAHQIANALAAAAAAFALGMNTSEIAAGLSMHQSSARWRMELTELDGVTLLNDSYNASPESMTAALKALVLLTQERGGRSWAFLGRMHELGERSNALHHEIGNLVRELKIDHLVAIGTEAYLSATPDSPTKEHLTSDLESALELLNEVEDGDVVLVKASRAEGLERLAAELVRIRSVNGTGVEK